MEDYKNFSSLLGLPEQPRVPRGRVSVVLRGSEAAFRLAAGQPGRVYIYMYMHRDRYTSLHIYTGVCVCVYTNTYIYIHIYIYIQSLRNNPSTALHAYFMDSEAILLVVSFSVTTHCSLLCTSLRPLAPCKKHSSLCSPSNRSPSGGIGPKF